MSVRAGVRHPSSLIQRAVFAFVLATILVVGGVTRASADITYVYDELGRLVGVVDPASDTAVYSYDGVGNLLGIARYASSSVSIIEFEPKSGPVGTVVTIHGTGFSGTPASNTVTFNGVTATVTSSTATSLVVSVPAGATTGTIGVTSPSGSATSSGVFTVTATGAGPTITGFSPAIALPGTSVTISGTGFEASPLNNRVAFYGVPPAKSLVTSATTTSLSVPVPTTARSGPITVSTPGGTAVSAADFFVPMGGFNPSDVVLTGRITIGGASVDVPLTTTQKYALLLFVGVAGQRLDLGTVLLSGFGVPGVTIYRPDGTTLTTTGSTSARYLPPLPMSGVYVIALHNGTFTHTLRLTLSEEITATAVVGGSAVNVSVPRAGQRARLTFSGTAGQRIDLGMTFTMQGVTASFKTADEVTTLSSGGISSPGELHSAMLPSTGTYLLLVELGSPGTGSFTATLSEEVTGSITTGGASVPVSITRAGQRARVTFAGTSGQGLGLGLTSLTTNGAVTVYRPDGATVGSAGFSMPSGGLDFGLVSTGTHAILIDPSGIGTGNATLTLSEALGSTTTLNGPPVSVNITRPGQAAYLQFSGTAGQRASHALSGTTISGTVSVFYSGGGLVPGTSLPSTTFLEPVTLPVTTTYYVYINPGAANTGSTTVTSYAVPADVTGTLTINGGTVPVTLSTPGQKAILSFAGTSGQNLTVRMTGNTVGCVLLVVTDPTGGTQSTSICSATLNFGVSLTSTGTHTLKIDPLGAATGSATVEVTIP
jgi:YD repeat-containing protein